MKAGSLGFTFNNNSADELIGSGQKVLHTITINGCTTTGVITVYDNITNSGTIVAEVRAVKDLAPQTLFFGAKMATGIYADWDSTAVANLTFTFYPPG